MVYVHSKQTVCNGTGCIRFRDLIKRRKRYCRTKGQISYSLYTDQVRLDSYKSIFPTRNTYCWLQTSDMHSCMMLLYACVMREWHALRCVICVVLPFVGYEWDGYECCYGCWMLRVCWGRQTGEFRGLTPVVFNIGMSWSRG